MPAGTTPLGSRFANGGFDTIAMHPAIDREAPIGLADGKRYQVFFVVAPDALCYYFHQELVAESDRAIRGRSGLRRAYPARRRPAVSNGGNAV